MKEDISVSRHLELSFCVALYYFLSQNITQVLDVNISAEKTEEEEILGINEPKSPKCELAQIVNSSGAQLGRFPNLITHSWVHIWPESHHLLVPVSVFQEIHLGIISPES